MKFCHGKGGQRCVEVASRGQHVVWDGELKEQKVTNCKDVFHGTLSLTQWHMKPFCSLTDNNRLWLLVKVRCTVHSLMILGLSYYSLNSEC